MLSRIKRAIKPLVGVFIPRYRTLSYEAVFRQLSHWNNDRNSPCYSFNHYQSFLSILKKCGAANPRTVLELGPGAQLGTLYCFLAAGADRAAGLDVAPTTKDLAFFHRLHEYLRIVSGFRWWRAPGLGEGLQYPDHSWDEVSADDLAAKIEYHTPYLVTQMPFGDGEFDLVYSGAAMEHFDNPRGAIREIKRVLKPGGVTVHGIDLRSHAPGDLSHLMLTEADYQARTQKYDPDHGINDIIGGEWTQQVYCNRILADEWMHLFAEEGFEVLECATLVRVDPATIDPAEFAAPFSGRTAEELAPLVITIAARKAG
jgi:SAM-dependent methyltransferase